MTHDASSWVRCVADAETALARADPLLLAVITANGPLDALRYQRSPFAALVGAIISQQLSGRAASTIAARVAATCGTTPEALAACPMSALRTAGLSGAKSRAVQGVVRAIASASLDLDRLCGPGVSAQTVRAALCALPGVGPWTADMFLMFGRADLDVFAPGDLGLRRAVQRLDGLAGLPAPDLCAARAGAWSPYRTVASWHLWRWLEATPGLSPAP